MNDINKRIKKVVEFYQLLPENIANEVFKNFYANKYINRSIRRNISSIKSFDKKIEFIISSALTRKIFSDAAYITIKDNIDLTLDNTEYDEIVDNITEANKLYYTIFFFRWCYECGKDGVDNDDKYFVKFVDSELFENILNGKIINNDSIKNKSLNSETATEIVNAEQNENIKDLNDEVAKMKLLGRIERRGTYYNFFPQYMLVDETFEEISAVTLKSDFPNDGGINLSHDFKVIPYKFLENIKVDSDSDSYTKNIYLVEFDSDDLENNDNTRYQKKIDLEKLVNSGRKLKDVIKNSDEIGIYKIVTSESTDFISDKIFLKQKDCLLENEKVLLLYENNYFGPFEVYYRPFDDKYYINPRAYDNNYLIPYYSTDTVDSMEFEKQPSYGTPYYTNYAKIIGKSSLHDAITDEILLEELKNNNISLELAINDSKEFVQTCKKIPFFLNISESKSELRIKRLNDLINNSNKLNEKKQEILSELMKQYPNAINSSKEVQDRDESIRKLEQEKDNLNQKIDDLNKQLDSKNEINSSMITSEQIQQYKDEISKLKEELEELKELERVTEDIAQLKDEQRKLENNNEYLRNQKTKLENESREAMNAVNNAIKSGIEKSAEVAFDPYISDVMLKEAEQWASKSEDDKYKEHIENLEKLSASSLSDEELISHIVNHVRKSRAYDYNDIINIYISVAQNFLTIFSGEPGTGKTSMCKIIADSLGLSNINVDRFIPVSVERGWSSKRDLIGYFNPLTRKYDKSNSKIYDALRILDKEKNNSQYPYIITLDEANLSPMEYYWADFMRLTDMESDSNRFINIGTEANIFVPETLKFIATINTDQTTEILSPRLIDRACIIKLPEVSIIKDNDQSKSTVSAELITWNNFKSTFSKESEIKDSTTKVLTKIYELFTSCGMNVSPRIKLIIKKYVKSAQEIMVDEVASKSETAIDYAVVQKLLPKINGYYSNYEAFFKSLQKICTENNLKMTSKAIDKMIADQERNMGYCQYLI